MFKEKDSKGKNSQDINLPSSDSPRKLSARDVALGLGRKATEEELEEYLNRPHGAAIPLKKAVENIKRKLQKSRKQKDKWK